MGYSIKVSPVKGFDKNQDALKGLSPLVQSYPNANPIQQDNIMARLTKELGGKGAQQAIKGVMGYSNL